MLEIKGLGTPNIQISKTHVRKHLNNKYTFGLLMKVAIYVRVSMKEKVEDD